MLMLKIYLEWVSVDKSDKSDNNWTKLLKKDIGEKDQAVSINFDILFFSAAMWTPTPGHYYFEFRIHIS